MFSKDWSDLGDRLNDVIENAVGKGNFGHLSDSISESISDVMESIDKLWEKARRPDSKSSDGSLREAPEGYDEDVYNDELAAIDRDPERYFAGGTRRKGGAIGRIAGGVILLVLAAVFLLISGALVMMMEAGLWVWGFPAVLFLLGIIVTSGGISRLRLAKSFDLYMRVLKNKLFIDIKTLAAYAHKTEALVLKDVKKMMSCGWFLQGHLDHAGSCLMISDQVYEQYLATMKNVQQQSTTAKGQEQPGGKDTVSPEVQAVMDKGQEFIEQIRACNDKIPGEEVSQKIFRMEQLVQKIFQQARLHPENIPDLRKFMEYYLPMSIKLLTAYQELDSQPVQGENIASSKLEIMKALDTLNVAFEKLLESLFQDTVMDVSTDISVLQTLLAQDGLTDSGFPKK